MIKSICPTLIFAEKQVKQIEAIRTNPETGEIMNSHDIEDFEDLLFLGIVYFENDIDGQKEWYLSFYGRQFRDELLESEFHY